MDIISLGKAGKALRSIQSLDKQIVAPLAEDRFPTVKARLDWLEGQAAKLKAENSKQLDLSMGVFANTEMVNGKIQLKKISEVGGGYSDNIIPTMTSNTSPLGIVSASSIYGSGNDSWLAFDGKVPGTDSQWASNGITGWLGYQFQNKIKITKYVVIGGAVTNASPKTWTFEASHDGANWVVLDSRSNVVSWTAYERKEFLIVNTEEYTRYRINVSANNGASSYVMIAQLEMMESSVVSTFTPSGTYESPIIDLGDGWKETKLVDVVKQIETGYTSNVIPIMTSNSTPSGVAKSSSSYTSAYSAYKAMDGQVGTSGNYWRPLGATNEWIEYDFGTSIKIGKYKVTSNSAFSPKSMRFEGWNGSDWISLDEKQNITWSGVETKSFTCKSESCTKYRLFIVDSNVGGFIQVQEIEMMESLPGTDAIIEVSTSDDGVTFSPYQTLAVQQGRYVKIRATLSAQAQNSDDQVYEFDQTENKVSLNEFTQADGDLKLKTAYSSDMLVDGPAGTGQVHSTVIDKDKFKKIVKIEVR